MVIGIYPRKSVYRDNSDSVQVQIQLCREYASLVYKGQPLEFRVYDKDEGFSGKNTNRPSFQAMMRDVEDDVLDAVVVYKLDRIARNVAQFSAMYEIFQRHNVAFVSVKESFDTSSPMGRTVMFILAAFAQLERENTSERVSDSMLSLGTAGKWTGGILPLGMRSVRRKSGDKEHSYLIVDPEEIGFVKLMFQMLLEGNSITRLERYCRDHSLRSRNGKFMSTSQLHSLITNPVYCQNSADAYDYFSSRGCRLPDPELFDGQHGLIGYGRTKSLDTTHRKQACSQWIIAIGIHDPVIPASDWIAAQERLGVNKMYRKAKYDIGLLKGVARCRCGSRMDIRTYRKNGLTFSYYYCARMARQGKDICNSEYVRVEQIDEAFLQELRRMRLNPSLIQCRKEVPEGLDPEMLQAELLKTQKAIGNLTAALQQAMDTPAAAYIIDQISSLDAQKRALESDLRKARRLRFENNALAETELEIHQNICYLLDHLDHIDYTAKNEMIRKIMKSCIIEENGPRIIF
ncbi:MAG: recombinase family protein [Eubacteriales bacterium]|nr:recombinase family protein [Eubacteriales bacterium]